MPLSTGSEEANKEDTARHIDAGQFTRLLWSRRGGSQYLVEQPGATEAAELSWPG